MYPWLVVVVIVSTPDAVWIDCTVVGSLFCIITLVPDPVNVLIPVAINWFAVIPAPTTT